MRIDGLCEPNELEPLRTCPRFAEKWRRHDSFSKSSVPQDCAHSCFASRQPLGLGDPAIARSVKVIVIGDNNIRGKGLALSEAYPAQLERALQNRGIDATVLNAGRNGDTAVSVLGRLNALVPAGTDVAVVSIGVNDVVYNGVDPDASRANVREIGRRLRGRGVEVVLLPTGGRFQGALAAKPEYHIEQGFGPKPGTTEWH